MKKKRKKRVWRSDMRSEEMAEWVIFSPTPKDFDYEEEEEEEERTLRVAIQVHSLSFHSPNLVLDSTILSKFSSTSF